MLNLLKTCTHAIPPPPLILCDVHGEQASPGGLGCRPVLEREGSSLLIGAVASLVQNNQHSIIFF